MVKINIVDACRELYTAIEALDAEACRRLSIDRAALRCLNFLEAGPRKPGEIAAHLGLTSGSVSSLLARLEARGFAVRKPDPTDGRARRVEMTPAVTEVLGPLYGGVARRLSQTVAAYPEAEQAMAVRHLFDAASAYRAGLDE
ncbi:MAG: MarR family winged helix-turn-helix transcriptional regulator [Shimia sp.]